MGPLQTKFQSGPSKNVHGLQRNWLGRRRDAQVLGTLTKAAACSTALMFAAAYLLAAPSAQPTQKPIELKRTPRMVEQPIECMAPQSLSIDFARAHCFLREAR